MIGMVKDHIEDLVEYYADHFEVGRDYINSGHCSEFAEDLVAACGVGEAYWIGEIYDGPFEMLYDVSHCAALIQGLWYDAETPEGVKDWRKLGDGRWEKIWEKLSKDLSLEPVYGTTWQFNLSKAFDSGLHKPGPTPEIK